MKIEMVTKQMEDGCIICTSHKHNPDGYLRKRHEGDLIMWHRKVWIDEHGPIPEGYEIDHKCRNRACFNLDHLQMLEGSEHASKGNRERYSHIKAAGVKLREDDPRMTCREIADALGLSYERVWNWFRGN